LERKELEGTGKDRKGGESNGFMKYKEILIKVKCPECFRGEK